MVQVSYGLFFLLANSFRALKETKWACSLLLKMLIILVVYVLIVADPTSLPNVQNVDRLKLKLAEFISNYSL